MHEDIPARTQVQAQESIHTHEGGDTMLRVLTEILNPTHSEVRACFLEMAYF
jgi:hypothetical protein